MAGSKGQRGKSPIISTSPPAGMDRSIAQDATGLQSPLPTSTAPGLQGLPDGLKTCDSAQAGAPPAVTLPPWLKIGGAAARARAERGEGPCLWTGRAPRHRVGGVEASPVDVERVRAAMRTGDRESHGGPVAAGAAAVAWLLRLADLSPRVLPRRVRDSIVGREPERVAVRWLRRVCGKPVGITALRNAWKACRPQDWKV